MAGITATVRQVQDLWVEHQGWGKWGSSSKRRFDAIVLERSVRRFPAPLSFWKALFDHVPVGAQAVFIEHGLPSMLQEWWQRERKAWEADRSGQDVGMHSLGDILREAQQHA